MIDLQNLFFSPDFIMGGAFQNNGPSFKKAAAKDPKEVGGEEEEG